MDVHEAQTLKASARKQEADALIFVVVEVSCKISCRTHGSLKIHLFIVVMPKNISDSVFKNSESSADQQEKKNETNERKILPIFFSIELQRKATSALTLDTSNSIQGLSFLQGKK